MTVASIVQGLHWRLMSLLDSHHTSSLIYLPCCKCLNQGKKPFNTRYSILNDGKTLQQCRNTSDSRIKVTIRTRPHLEKHCIISWWLMFFPPCGPSATNHMNFLLVALKRRHQNCYCVVLDVFWIVEMTEILIASAKVQIDNRLHYGHTSTPAAHSKLSVDPCTMRSQL